MFCADRDEYVERYRSGHNEAVLKTVCPKGRVGSNPTLSVLKEYLLDVGQLEKYPSWPKGLPWKGSRSLTRRKGSNPFFCAMKVGLVRVPPKIFDIRFSFLQNVYNDYYEHRFGRR